MTRILASDWSRYATLCIVSVNYLHTLHSADSCWSCYPWSTVHHCKRYPWYSNGNPNKARLIPSRFLTTIFNPKLIRSGNHRTICKSSITNHQELPQFHKLSSLRHELLQTEVTCSANNAARSIQSFCQLLKVFVPKEVNIFSKIPKLKAFQQ